VDEEVKSGGPCVWGVQWEWEDGWRVAGGAGAVVVVLEGDVVVSVGKASEEEGTEGGAEGCARRRA